MAPVPYTSYMAFLDPENKSWAPGQVLIITETTGDTACPVYAVHHNYTWYNPATRNLFVRKEANAAARALKVRECFCVGPQQFYWEIPTCLSEEHPAYEQDNPESESFEKFPLAYQAPVDELTVKSGILTNQFPEFYYPELPKLLDKYIKYLGRNKGFFSGDLGPTFGQSSANVSDSPEPFNRLYYNCSTGEFVGESSDEFSDWCYPPEITSDCLVRVHIQATFSPCIEAYDGVPFEKMGLFYFSLDVFQCPDYPTSRTIPLSHYTEAIYYAWKRPDPRIDLLNPVLLTKVSDYSTAYAGLDEFGDPVFQGFLNEQSPIDWPETLTLTPVY